MLVNRIILILATIFIMVAVLEYLQIDIYEGYMAVTPKITYINKPVNSYYENRKITQDFDKNALLQDYTPNSIIIQEEPGYVVTNSI